MEKSHESEISRDGACPKHLCYKGRSRDSLTKRARIGDSRELVFALRLDQSQSSTRSLLWFASMSLGGQKYKKKGSRCLGDLTFFYPLPLSTECANQQSEK